MEPRRGYWNNQAPEPGGRRRDPPRLEAPRRHGHNRNERPDTTPGKMAALPALLSCGLSANGDPSDGREDVVTSAAAAQECPARQAEIGRAGSAEPWAERHRVRRIRACSWSVV